MEPTNILPIVAVLLLPAVEYGGWGLLAALTGRLPVGELAGWQKQFWRAAHAHTGVLLVLSLVYLLYLPAPSSRTPGNGSSESCCSSPPHSLGWAWV